MSATAKHTSPSAPPRKHDEGHPVKTSGQEVQTGVE